MREIRAQNVEAAKILMVGWINEMFGGPDGIHAEPGEVITIDTPAGQATAQALPSSLTLWHPFNLLQPFVTAIDMKTEFVMVGHATYPALDGEHIASQSPAVVDGLLRDRMGFGGLVVSDALEMGAIAASWPLPVAAERALTAGVDQLILSDHTRVPEVVGQLERAVAAGRLPRARAREAFLRVQRFKRVDRWAGC